MKFYNIIVFLTLILNIIFINACGSKSGTDTAGLPGTTPPSVSSTIPADNASIVPVNGSITATFSEEMNPLTITFTLKQGTTPVSGILTYSGVTAVFTPDSDLAANTTYTAVITAEAGNLTGNTLADDFIWSFTTGAIADNTAPGVSSTFPADSATDAAVNGSIMAVFSEGMNPLTITGATYKLKHGAAIIPGNVNYSGVTATFTPDTDLAYNETYTAEITTAAADLAGNAIAAQYTWSFTTGTAPDTTAPTVSSTIPIDTSADTAINGNISATFSEGMDPLTITNVSFTLMQGAASVAGTVSYTGIVATFDPADDLDYNTTYTARITTTAKDLAGNALLTEKTWSFTTGADPDITAPTVNSTIPIDAAADIAINGSISATFSEGMNSSTITTATFTLKHGATPITGTVTYTGLIATFAPSSDLAYSTTYTATITNIVKDLAGNAMLSDYTWSFTTGTAPDLTPPMVNITYPSDSATGVVTGGTVTATFSESMDPLTITTATFTLTKGGTPVSGSVTYFGVTATFTPDADLDYSTVYIAKITTGVKDLAGNSLASDKIWSFTTAGMGPAPVNLRTAGNYVMLAKAGITIGAGSSITGDVAVSPIGSGALVGFGLILDGSGTFSTSPHVTGKVYASNYLAPTPGTLVTAVEHMQFAYSDAAGRPGGINLGSGELGGRIIPPGLYNWGAAVLITTDVTLNGGPNDIWIFQINGALTMAAAKRVNLTGGANAKNIFWQTVGAVSLGASARLEGIVLSNAAVTLGAGAKINGRVYAETAETAGAGSDVIQPLP